MSETALIWLFGLIAMAIVGIFGLLFNQLKAMHQTREQAISTDIRVQSLRDEVAAIKTEIGGGDKGIRGSIHKLREETRTALYSLEKSVGLMAQRSKNDG